MTHLVFFFFHGASEPVDSPARIGRTVRADFRVARRAEFRGPTRAAGFRVAKRSDL